LFGIYVQIARQKVAEVFEKIKLCALSDNVQYAYALHAIAANQTIRIYVMPMCSKELWTPQANNQAEVSVP